MIQVGVFYQEVSAKYGIEVARRFSELMHEWDGGEDYRQAYYEEGLLRLKLKEAFE